MCHHCAQKAEQNPDQNVFESSAILVQRLDYFITHLEDIMRPKRAAASADFQVITGVGNRSKAGHAQLREETLALLEHEGLAPRQVSH